MVDGVGKVNPLQQQFSSNGIKLSELKQENELLFNYFTNAGYKEDQVIYSTDIEKLKDAINSQDEDDREKMTFKELRKAGFEGSRKDLRNLRNTMSSIQKRQLESDEEYLKEYVSENEVNYRKADGTLGKVEVTEGNRVVSKYLIDGDGSKVSRKQEVYSDNEGEHTSNEYYINGNETLVEKSKDILITPDGKTTTSVTEYLDGDRNKPSKITTKQDGNEVVTDFTYNEGKLQLKTVKNGQDSETTTYEYYNGKRYEKSVREQLSSDPESFALKQFERNEQGEITKITIKYSGSKIGKNKGYKTGEEYSFDKPISPESINVDFDKFAGKKVVTRLGAEGVEETETSENKDGTMNSVETVVKTENLAGDEELEYYKEFDGKRHRVEKDDKGNYYVTIKMPKGWNIQRLEYEFGVSKDSILKANKDSDGDALYHTNSKGVNYFYEGDKVKILNPTKIQTQQKNGEEGEITFLYGEEAKLDEINKPKNVEVNHSNNQRANNRTTSQASQHGKTIPTADNVRAKVHYAPKISNTQRKDFKPDEQGNLVCKKESADSITVVKADADMHVKTITKTSKTSPKIETTTAYRPDGKPTKIIKKTNTETATTSYEYTDSGNVKKVLKTVVNILHPSKPSTSEKEFIYSSYTSGGKVCLKMIKYTKDGKPDGYIEFWRNGNPKEAEYFDRQGKKTIRVVKSFDREQNLLSEQYYDNRGWCDSIQYDLNGVIVSELHRGYRT